MAKRFINGDELVAIKGADGSAAIGAGYVGEVVAGASDAPVSLGSNNTTKETTNITLTPGVWNLKAAVYLDTYGVTLSRLQCWVGTTPNSSSGTLDPVLGFGAFEATQTLPSGYVVALTDMFVTVTSTTTLYINHNATYSGSSPGTAIRAAVRAVRIA